MTDLSGLREAVALALTDPDPVEAVRVVCRSVAEALPVDGAAISTMTSTQHRETVCASDQVANGLEELQFTLGEGPCFEAFATDAPVLVPDLGAVTSSTWPIYASRAAAHSEARAVFVFPLSFGALPIGTLSTYRATSGPLDAQAVAGGVELAETAALVLLSVRDPAGTVAQLQRESTAGEHGARVTQHERVHLAAGMLAEQLGLPPDAAFDRMRGHAFLERRLLIDVASDILDRRLRLEPDTA